MAQKFAIAYSGVLVYRHNGKMYNGRYTVKFDARGHGRVYGPDGKFLGTVGKGTKKEQRLIEQIDKRNRSKRRQALKRKTEEWGKVDLEKAVKSKSLNDWLQVYMSTKDVPRDSWKKFAITYAQQSKMNYAKILSDLVRNKAISKADAQAKWEEMSSTSDFSNDADDETRSKLWEELRDEYPEVFYKYKE